MNDGDTLTLTTGARVRLVQIDAPELYDDCYGKAARVALRRLVPNGSRVTLVRDPALDATDRYGRRLRYVVSERHERQRRPRSPGRRLAVLLPRRARPLRRRPCSTAVDGARAAQRGYWGACPGARLDTRRGSITGHA